MPSKQRERFYFEALRRAIAEFPAGEILEPDPPDFVVVAGERRLGIEITTFHMPPPPGKRPHQEQQSLKDRIVQIAEELHHDAGGPALYVYVHFSEHEPLVKRDIQPMAQAIADAVLGYDVPGSIREPAVEIPWGRRPKGTWGIQIHGSVDGVDRLWHADAGGWVASLRPEDVAHAVRAKGRQEPLARTHCAELWLVLVNDWLSRAAPVELSGEACQAAYLTPFDKLIWLLPHAPQAIELVSRRPAT